MLNEIAKNTKKAIIADLCNSLEKKRKEMEANGGDGLPYGYVSSQLNGVRIVCPSITRHDVNNELRRREKKRKAVSISAAAIVAVVPEENQVSTVATKTAYPDNSPKKGLGGRPVVSSGEK